MGNHQLSILDLALSSVYTRGEIVEEFALLYAITSNPVM